jgi:hypothetical protein
MLLASFPKPERAASSREAIEGKLLLRLRGHWADFLAPCIMLGENLAICHADTFFPGTD